MIEHKYKLTYSTEPHAEGVLRSEIPDGHGACDALAMVSLIYPPDGSLSAAVLSVDGKTGEPLTANELFKAWMMMTIHLARRDDLSDAKRELCNLVHETIRAAIAGTTCEESNCLTNP